MDYSPLNGDAQKEPCRKVSFRTVVELLILDLVI